MEDTITETNRTVLFVKHTVLDLSKFQPRTTSEPKQALVEDIRRAGKNEQVVKIRPNGKSNKSPFLYDVVAGHKRVSAIAKLNADLPEDKWILVECIISDDSIKDDAMTALIDNELHEELQKHERDYWIARLVLEYGWSYKELDKRLPDINEESIINIVRAYRDSSPTINKLLVEGTISTGHAKAIVSLPGSDQEDIALKIIDHKGWTGVSVRDTEKWAKLARTKNMVFDRCLEYFKALNKGEILCEGHEQIVNQLFDPDELDGFRVPKQVVDKAAKQAGVTIKYPTLAKKMKDLYDSTSSIPSQPVPQSPKIKKSVALCPDCTCFNWDTLECAVDMLDGKDYGKVEVCGAFLRLSEGSINVTKKCMICKHHTIFDHPDSGYLSAEPNELGLKYFRANVAYRFHTQCLVDYMIQQKLLGGLCETCNGDMCPFIHSELAKSLVQQVQTTVSKCGYFYHRKSDIKKINKWATEEYTRALEAQDKKDGEIK